MKQPPDRALSYLSHSHLRDGHFHDRHFHDGNARSSHVRDGRVRDNHVRSGHVRDGRVRDGHVRGGRVHDRPVRGNRVRSGHVREGYVRDGRLDDGHLRHDHFRDGGTRDGGTPSRWTELPRPIRILAPMEGVTDTVFRRIVAEAGRPDVFFTEFTGADSLTDSRRPSALRRLRHYPVERPLVAQIWGNRPESYRAAASEIAGSGFAGVDINMGCPVRKLAKKGYCSALIDNPALAAELIAAAREGAGALPVSVKTRIGVQQPCTERWIGFLLEQELDAITLHGRVAEQMSEGEADWSAVARAVELRDAGGYGTLIIGNGDVAAGDDPARYSERYGVDGVMAGRVVFEDLFFFREDSLRYADLSPREKIDYLYRHCRSYQREWGAAGSFDELKKFVETYIGGFSGAERLTAEFMGVRDYESAYELLERWAGRSRRRRKMPEPAVKPTPAPAPTLKTTKEERI